VERLRRGRSEGHEAHAHPGLRAEVKPSLG
jgi:hypothetical protein